MSALLGSASVRSLAWSLEWRHLRGRNLVRDLVWTQVPVLILSWSLQHLWAAHESLRVRSIGRWHLLSDDFKLSLWRGVTLEHGLDLGPLGVDG